MLFDGIKNSHLNNTLWSDTFKYLSNTAIFEEVPDSILKYILGEFQKITLMKYFNSIKSHSSRNAPFVFEDYLNEIL